MICQHLTQESTNDKMCPRQCIESYVNSTLWRVWAQAPAIVGKSSNLRRITLMCAPNKPMWQQQSKKFSVDWVGWLLCCQYLMNQIG